MRMEYLLYIGSAVLFLWGAAHIVPAKNVADNFGPISLENRRIILMEWISEGLTLCFLSLLVFLVTFLGGTDNHVSIIVIRATATMLLVMAVLTLFTGAKTSIIPIKICPLVKTIVAVLFFLGSC